MSTVQRRQALFDEFNKGGSTVTLSGDGHETTNLGLVDSYRVTRAVDDVFWLMFKMAGYQWGFHHAHTIKVVSWTQEDGWELDLVDDRDRLFHIELVFPELEPALGGAWQRWRAYKKANRAMFRELDASLLDQHVAIAVGWEAP